jgi:hypothetical protein
MSLNSRLEEFIPTLEIKIIKTIFYRGDEREVGFFRDFLDGK